LSLAVAQSAFFLKTPRGRRFCVSSGPDDGAACGAALYVPPFAEEANKARRMSALAARALAARGWLTLRLDLGGCGDSEGDFADATWDGWRQDLDAAWAWLAAHAPQGRRLVWGLRAGALLAADWLRASGNAVAPDLLLWQPVFDGARHLSQFLRLNLVHQMLTQVGEDEAKAGLRARLDAGETVEIVGYALTPALAQALAAAHFAMPTGYGGRILMIELGRGARSPALEAQQEALAGAGINAQCWRVDGPAFWQTQEIEDSPALLAKTLAVLDDMPECQMNNMSSK
jgi:exosortase A-associated hydrolase 2